MTAAATGLLIGFYEIASLYRRQDGFMTRPSLSITDNPNIKHNKYTRPASLVVWCLTAVVVLPFLLSLVFQWCPSPCT